MSCGGYGGGGNTGGGSGGGGKADDRGCVGLLAGESGSAHFDRFERTGAVAAATTATPRTADAVVKSLIPTPDDVPSASTSDVAALV
jgi:hypothetical protein